MPNFPVNDSPIQVAQVSTQPAALQNAGAKNIYFGNDASVSAANPGFFLSPGSSIVWPGAVLYAVTAAGETSALNVLYDAQAAAPGTVAVSGISTPVIVQGGGEKLADFDMEFDNTGGASIVLLSETIANPNPFVYSGLRVRIRLNPAINPGGTFPLFWQMLSDGETVLTGSGTVFSTTAPVICVGESGLLADFSVPLERTYPLTFIAGIDSAIAGQNFSINVEVFGIPQSNFAIESRNERHFAHQRVTVSTSVSGTVVYIPPTFTPMYLRPRAFAGTSYTNIVLERLPVDQWLAGIPGVPWETIAAAMHRKPFVTVGDIDARTGPLFVVGGSGLAERVTLSTSTGGSDQEVQLFPAYY